ncbi:MAG TPA: FtsX-like permease family protein [Candidatus Polarisedimenticolia bacterium]
MRARPASRLRVAARFLARSLDLRATSFLLALSSVAVGISVVAMSLALKADVSRKMSRELRAYGPNLIVTPGAGLGGGTLDASVTGSLASVLSRTEMDQTPLLYAAGRAGGLGLTLAGIEFDSARRLFPYWRVRGAWPAPGDGDSSLVGARLAGRLKVGPGQALRIEVGGHGAELRVAGLVTTGEAEEEQVFVPLALLQGLAGTRGISTAALRIDAGPDEVEAAARDLEAAVPGISARPLRQVSRAEGSLLERLDVMMGLLSALMLAMTVLCVMTTLVSIVVERQPEIGLMRSLGAGDGEIILMLLGEATLLGLAGGLLGYGLGVAGARLLGHQLFGAAIAARPEVIPVVTGLALAICWAGTLLPLRRALAIRPADALRGE